MVEIKDDIVNDEPLNIEVENTKLKDKFEVDFEYFFRKCGLPVISFNDGVNFLVDTGSSINLLKESFVKENKLESTNANGTTVNTASGSFKTKCTFMNLHLNEGIEYKDVQFQIAELNIFDYHKDFVNLNIVGIIGSRFMAKHNWKIDYEFLKLYI